ncbi:MAG: polysaccharide deacetylase family protein [Clostridiaceae bacterium]|nr:polysaccharide deacetylase family protein [Clostridiaceae bacterium]
MIRIKFSKSVPPLAGVLAVVLFLLALTLIDGSKVNLNPGTSHGQPEISSPISSPSLTTSPSPKPTSSPTPTLSPSDPSTSTSTGENTHTSGESDSSSEPDPSGDPASTTNAPPLPTSDPILSRPIKERFADLHNYNNKQFGWTVYPQINLPNNPNFYSSVSHSPDQESKRLYLTFNLGYDHDDNTIKILDTLKAKKVPAAFFIDSFFTRRYLEHCQRILDDNHIIANHTILHNNQVTFLQQGNLDRVITEAIRLDELFLETYGKPMTKMIRPPSGEWSQRLLEVYRRLGYATVMYSVAYTDWDVNNQPDPAESLEDLMEQIHPGAIILLHPMGSTNVTIMGDFIDRCRAERYEFLSLTEIPGLVYEH